MVVLVKAVCTVCVVVVEQLVLVTRPRCSCHNVAAACPNLTLHAICRTSSFSFSHSALYVDITVLFVTKSLCNTFCVTVLFVTHSVRHSPVCDALLYATEVCDKVSV